MATKSFFRLENLSVRADGLSSMAHALRDCFVELCLMPLKHITMQ